VGVVVVVVVVSSSSSSSSFAVAVLVELSSQTSCMYALHFLQLQWQPCFFLRSSFPERKSHLECTHLQVCTLITIQASQCNKISADERKLIKGLYPGAWHPCPYPENGEWDVA